MTGEDQHSGDPTPPGPAAKGRGPQLHGGVLGVQGDLDENGE